MSENRVRSAAIMLLLAIVTVGATVAVALLLVGEDSRTDKFFIAIAGLCLAELITFAYLTRVASSPRKDSGTVPTRLGAGVMVLIYDIGVVALTLVAIAPVAFPIILALHIVLLALLTVFLGFSFLGGSHASSIDAAEKEQRQPMRELRAMSSSIIDRLDLVKSDEIASFKSALRKFADDDLKFAAQESPAGSEQADADLREGLKEVEAIAGRIEQAATGGSDSSLGDLVSESDRQLAVVKQFLKKRETLVGELRS